MPVTLIHNAAWAVVWDGQQHCYAQGIDIVFDETGVLHLGDGWQGSAAHEIDGRGLLVMPGLVNIHCHSGDEPLAKGLFDDVGTPALWGNALYEYSTLIDSDADAKTACQVVMISELLRSGVTSFLDIAGDHPTWLSTARDSGARAWLGPGFRQARWRVEGGHRLEYDWDEAAGREAYEEALSVLDRISADASGRLSGVMTPSQIETCRPDLIQEAIAEARSRGVPVTIHAAQTMAEHEELLRRHGQTAPEYLNALEVLGPDLILGHCIYLDHHPWTRQRQGRDLALLAESDTSVAHCPVTFARSGQGLHSAGGYLRAGVNLGIGTDTSPFNMLEEMRMALLISRQRSGDVADIDTGAVFHAATVNGAKALRRDDLGRLAPGMQADIVLVELAHSEMQPVHDPLRSLLHCAAERAVRDVYVAGRQVVDRGKVLGLDHAGAVAELNAAQARSIRVAEENRSRSISEIAPLSLKRMGQ